MSFWKKLTDFNPMEEVNKLAQSVITQAATPQSGQPSAAQPQTAQAYAPNKRLRLRHRQ